MWTSLDVCAVNVTTPRPGSGRFHVRPQSYAPVRAGTVSTSAGPRVAMAVYSTGTFQLVKVKCCAVARNAGSVYERKTSCPGEPRPTWILPVERSRATHSGFDSV